MVASFPEISHAQLFYRALERDKTKALQQQKGDFEAIMTYSSETKSDLKWWVKNIPTMSKFYCALLTLQFNLMLHCLAGRDTAMIGMQEDNGLKRKQPII